MIHARPGLRPEDAAPEPAVASPAAAPIQLDRRGLLHLQRTVGNHAVQRMLARDFAIEPVVPEPAEETLTAEQLQSARRFNSVLFTDAAEISVLRDVLGVAKEPAVVDDDFTNAVVRYQSSFGLTPDGMLGGQTAGRLEQELTAEADGLGEPPTGTPLRRAARRLHLRSLVSRRRGRATHQGFVGDPDNPEGAVTVRAGDTESGVGNMMSLEYTGENANNVNWLQFISFQMFATPPGGVRTFNTGALSATGGPTAWSNATTTNWDVDAVPGGSPFYNTSGGLNTRAAARRVAIFDDPGGASGLPFAQAFTAPGGLAAGATRVTLRISLASYVVRANVARYRVNWTATTTYDITAGTSSDIVYAQGTANAVGALAGVHRTALLAEYAGNPVH